MNNTHQALIRDMANSLFSDLAARGAGSEGNDNFWAEVEALSLHDLLVGQEAGGFGGSWKDAGIVFHAAARHGLSLPIGETIVVRSWLSRMGVALPAGALDFVFAEGVGGRQAHPCSRADRKRLVLDGLYWTLLSPGGGEVIASGPMTLDAEALLFEAALLRSCQIAGAMEAMLALSVDHVIGRVQFGKPLARFQAVQQQLAVLAEECAAVACASASACQAAALGDARFEIAAAKWRANCGAVASVDIAHQVHGAIGFTREYPLHRFSLQALKRRGEQGAEQYWAHWIGRFTLAARPLPLWHWLTARSDRVLEAEREALQ